MNIISKPLLLLAFLFNSYFSFCQDQIPFLHKKGNTTQLMVEGKPFIILGGELGNSSATTMLYMQPIWPKLKAMNLNTILVPVYWELIETEEGKFDFSLYQQLITEARTNHLKIVFLWFASWKNSMSSHVPAWVKLNQDKYPRAMDDKNRSQEILTPFSENNLQADLKAFTRFMGFIKDVDKGQQTVIMVQVENEIGMLPSARDYHPLANSAFKKDVPQELLKYMLQHKDKLVPEFLNVWKANGSKTSGNWEAFFGKGLLTDELFMAWYFSKYVNTIVEAGKKVYPLPMFVNAALNRPDKKPGSGYPSAGPLPHLMDVWKAAAPSIDFLAPDIYFSNFKHWNDLYTKQGNPLFIPEHRFDSTVAAKSLYAFGHYHALGFSPFHIESVNKPEDEPLGKIYRLVAQLAPLISSNPNKVEGVMVDKEHQDTTIRFGKYEFIFKHEYTLGRVPEAKAERWQLSGALIIQTAEDEFYIAGTGIAATFKSLNDSLLNVGILKIDEGQFENGKWVVSLHLNGDQTHQGRHLHIETGDYSIQRLRLYTYK